MSNDHPGFGVMLHQLFGGTDKNSTDFYGRTVVEARLENNRFILDFADGTKMILEDQGQSCCESRYITCDDDLSKLKGGKLKRVEVMTQRCLPDIEYGEHEISFVEVATDECFVTLCTHNEHNGYYGGFALNLSEA